MTSSKIIHDLVNRTPLKRFLASNRLVVRTYFNFIYQKTDPYQLEHGNQERKMAQAFALVENFSGASGLEIGCGEGRWSPRVAQLVDHLTSIDISDLAIKRARKKNTSSKIRYQQGDVLNIKISDRSLDFIFCSEVLYYLSLSELNRTIPRICKLLRPGGKLLLVHQRSLRDDVAGMELKEFGAKTIHNRFLESALVLDADLVEDTYRISLLSCRSDTCPAA